MTTTATINYINCTEDNISLGIKPGIKGATSLELLGTYSHPDHQGEADWNISLYEYDLNGYKGRVLSTNGDPVWEDDGVAFAETLAEYGIEANV